MPQYSFAVRNIGDYGDDFESTLQTGDNEYNKVQAVKHTGDDGIFLVDDSPDKVRLRIYAPDGSYKTSGSFQLSETLQPFDFFENQCPDETDWDEENLNAMQSGSLNQAESKIASYKGQRIPGFINPITSAGVRVWARFIAENDMIFVDKKEIVVNVS